MKTLKPYTIVPQELYVEREADRQVSEIIAHMGRPGYVLVARQMGKTNLLLNAKRQHGNRPNVFLYLDVSNCFPDIRSFFRNIIDVALDADNELEDLLRLKISDRRATVDFLPHKEHEWELREILRAIHGKLIICLDEIDALTSSSYSDQVFSFIRSAYFSGRSNFPEFSRLTYLLSGVAEPTDIIKNKDVSPFNIGEKIYLNDFTPPEFEDFFRRSGISGSQNVIDRVFYWTNGHPRMTWDVCSEIEDQRNNANHPKVVDDAVRKLYFSEVDMPPVDHIRQLVSSSKEIRDAIISIHYGRTASLSDSLKTKLYLAGVTSYNATSKQVAFKNRILEEALSESYLYKLESADSSANLDNCVKIAEAQDYASALPGLLIIIADTPDSSIKATASYWAGVCYFWLNEYEEALKFLSDDTGQIDRQQAVLKTFYRGVALWELKRYQPAEVYLDFVMRNQGQDLYWLHLESAAYLASLILADDRTRTEKAIELCTKVLEKLNSIGDPKPVTLQINQLRGFVTSTLSKAYRQIGDLAASSTILLEGLSKCTGYVRSALIFDVLEHAELPIEKFLLDGAVEAIVNTAEFVESFSYTKNAISLTQCQLAITRLNYFGRQDDITRVATHVFTNIPKGATLIDVLLQVFSFQGNASNRLLGVKLIGIALDTAGNSLTPNDLRELWRFILYVDINSGAKSYGKQYIESFGDDSSTKIMHADIRALYLLCTDYRRDIGEAATDAAVQLLQRQIENESQMTDVERESFGLLQEYIFVKRALEKGDISPIATKARELKRRLESVKEFELFLFPKDFLLHLRIVFLTLLKSSNLFTEKRERKKIGRNDIVRVSYNGEIKKGKYKKFMDDINSGACTILE